MAGRRHFLLVFDQTFSSSASLARARQAARDWIESALHPSDVVAIATFSVTRGAELLLGFTTDREQAELAIATLGAGDLVDAYADPLRLSLGTFRSGVLEDDQGPGAFLDGFRPLEDSDDARGQQQVIYVATQEPMNDQRRRHDVTALTRSFSDLARMMESVRGRKYVVYMSEGFDSSLVFATEDDSKQREMSDAIERGGYWLVDSNKRFGNAALQSSIFDMLDEFRRADCVIHAVDVGNITGDDQTRVLPASSNGLFLMAHETGGELYRNFGDLTGALDRMLDRTSVTYLLSFRPDRFDPPDESFHKIKIKLRNGPKEARVSHRPGYYPSVGEDDRPERKALRLGELVLAGGNHGAIPASVLAVPFPSAGGRAQVPDHRILHPDRRRRSGAHPAGVAPQRIEVLRHARPGARAPRAARPGARAGGRGVRRAQHGARGPRVRDPGPGLRPVGARGPGTLAARSPGTAGRWDGAAVPVHGRCRAVPAGGRRPAATGGVHPPRLDRIRIRRGARPARRFAGGRGRRGGAR
jgi:VWFA-related protein